MAYSKYVTQFKDKDDNVYGVMDEECRLSLQNGTHEDLTAGNALFLLSDRGETDNEPYAFRKTGGSKNAYGREMLKKIVGGTVGWNQMLKEMNSSNFRASSSTGSSVSISDGIATVNASLQYTGIINSQSNTPTIPTNHKVLCAVDVKLSSAVSNAIKAYWNEQSKIVVASAVTTWQTLSTIISWDETKRGAARVNDYRSSGFDAYQVRNSMLFDLTAMFGSTIADAIYAMEQATEGAGVAWFRSLFGKSYYSFNAGTLMSVNAESHALTGFNQWDEEWELGYYDVDGSKKPSNNSIRCKNLIPVIQNTTYCFTMPNNTTIRFRFFDADGNFVSNINATTSTASGYTFTIPNGCHYMAFHVNGTTYNNDICINLSDTSKDGTYEPYQLRSYPLANVELRGIPKWVDGQLVFDGDEYTPDGTVKRRYGIVNLGTLTWSYSSADLCFYTTGISELNAPTTTTVIISAICNGYLANTYANCANALYDKVFGAVKSGNSVYFRLRDTAYTDPAVIKEALSGVYLVYELDTPTTESADPYRELQISNRNGTEEFTDRAEKAGTRDVAIPVGTETFYPVDIFALIDSLQALILENISNS